MAKRGRPLVLFLQAGELWRQWKAGETQSAIAQALGQSVPAILARLRKRGGIVPPERRCRQGSLRLEEREEISRGAAEGLSLRRLGRTLGQAASAISREVARGGGAQAWRAVAAQVRAQVAALRPKPCRLAILPVLRDHVAAKLGRNWSPQQIAGWLKVTWPETPMMQVSHETTYKSLFIQARSFRPVAS